MDTVQTTNPVQRFMAWADSSAKTHAWCCKEHKAVVVAMYKAAKDGKAVSTKQLDFARDIVSGRAKHSEQVASEVLATITCAHRGCEDKVTGTRIQIGGEFKNRCEQHRS